MHLSVNMHQSCGIRVPWLCSLHLVGTVYVWFHCRASQPIQSKRAAVMWDKGCVGQGAFNLVRAVYVWFHCRASQPIQSKHAAVMWDRGSLVVWDKEPSTWSELCMCGFTAEHLNPSRANVRQSCGIRVPWLCGTRSLQLGQSCVCVVSLQSISTHPEQTCSSHVGLFTLRTVTK